MVINESILEKYNRFLKLTGLTHIRVEIKEDEDFGEALVESDNGTPSTILYDSKTYKWS